jgi:hypothetical protein
MLPRNQRAGSATAVADVPSTMTDGASPRSGQGAEFWFVPIAVFVTISVIFLSNTGDSLFSDPDLFWHIAVGRKILETGSFPWTDEFSHTFREHPWIAKEWLSQVVFALTYDTFGWKGLAALIGCAAALTFTMLFVVLAQRVRIVPALIIALFSYSLAASHFLVRPHLLSFPLLVLWLTGLVRAAETRTTPSLLLLPVMTLWANLHGGFTLGLAFVVPLAVEAIHASDPGSRVRVGARWAMFLVAAGLAALVTPYGPYPLWATYQLFGSNREALNYIVEWQPFNFAKEKYAGSLLLLALFVGLLKGFRLPPIRCLLMIGIIYMALIHVRFTALAAIIIPILVASPLARQFVSLSKDSPDHAFALVRNLVRKPLLLAILGAFAAVGIIFSISLPDRRPARIIMPVGAVDHIEANAGKGKVYNTYSFGGYLIFRGIPTFVDGRTDQLFGGDFLTKLYRTLKGTGREFLQLLDDHQVSLALVRPNSAEAHRLEESRRWRLAYADDVAVLYERVPK